MDEPTHRETSPALAHFHPVLRRWFRRTFAAPTLVQAQAWPLIAARRNTLLLAPTGSGKTLAAFLVAIDRMMFGAPAAGPGVRVLYISPLKALGVDVERNLRSPLIGVRTLAEAEGIGHHAPRVGVRSGDTTARARHELNRQPPDILITTPESLYLMLTSQARAMLRAVDTVIVDEIHSLASSKRGAHLFVSLERLEQLRRDGGQSPAALQRIGLSATQRPLEEIARLLGGAEAASDPEEPPQPRPVDIVQAGRGKQLELRIEVPVADMARLVEPLAASGSAAGPAVPSIWPAIHPRVVELIRAHRSTMIFVNSRRLAERLAAALNELAGEELVLAHHGSIAKDKRIEIEDKLKRGQLPAIVATSSLELGIDMGAVDLVIQIEAPPSIASGIQRIGRAGHQVGAPSAGVIFPKYRGDLLACAAATEKMANGEVEPTHYPRNPLDVLAQQLVAMTALEPVAVDRLYAAVRGAAPFFDLPRGSFEGVLDLLSGRYPADEFAELRPRVTWDRIAGEVQPRRGAQRVAIANAGTIPDRGLYGVFLAGGEGPGNRVGELDEEMVFETHPGDVFLLGASSWRVVDITHDRVLVVPAPGEPGRMPFWRGEGPGRPLDFGRAIGALVRRCAQLPRADAEAELVGKHGLDPRAARNLLQYLGDQAQATGEAPHDRALVVECFLDEVGDWRVAVLSPFGARVHVPWAMATVARLREFTSGEVDMVCGDDGMVFRLPESEEPPPLEWLFPAPDEIESLVVHHLGSTALFASRFRENAARALLLLPRRQPGRRTPLWLQRRRSADLLAVAARYPSFPILLETYRECLRDVFDLAGLQELLSDVAKGVIRVRCVRTRVASPFAASLMFNYTANFLYEGDAPLAERHAQLLALDQAQLRELLGDAEVRELLHAEAIDELRRELRGLGAQRRLRHVDAVHEALLRLGDLTRDELAQRCDPDALAAGLLDQWLAGLIVQRRVVAVRIAGESRFAAAEDAARLRDALGVVIAPGLPEAFLAPVADPLGDLVSRYARTHGPFKAEEIAARFGAGIAVMQAALARLAERGRLVEGEFLPGGYGREWCDAEVLRTLKRRSLARLRRQVEPVAPQALARFLPHWQGIQQPRIGLDGLLDVVEQLQGAPLPAADLERDILPRRVRGYRPGDLDELCAAGEIVWRGCESLGPGDGRIALFLADHRARLAPPAPPVENPLSERIRGLLAERGALFFEALVHTLQAFRHDVLAALWELVWAGHATNDTLAPLRSLRAQSAGKRSGRRAHRFRSRRETRLPGSEGRWSLFLPDEAQPPTATERLAAVVAQLLRRYGVLTREMAAAENIAGGFAGLYPVLKAMEEAGKIRRGYFVAGLGAAQFANPGAADRLRDFKNAAEEPDAEPLILAATDPANPYGTVCRWPESAPEGSRPQRAAGARVILSEGELVGYLGRLGQQLVTFPPEEAAARPRARGALARALARLATATEAVFLTRIDGRAPGDTDMAEALREAGFIPTMRGYLHRRRTEEDARE